MHIKTHLCICLAFLSGLPVLANGKGGFVDGIFRYSIQENVIVSTGDSTVVLTCADRSAIASPLPILETLVIPATVVHDGYEYQVAEIADTAFVRCGNIESIVISEGIGSIGSHAFYRCPRLRSVSIPSTVFYIGDNAFGQCPELQEIKVDSENETYDSRNGCNAIVDTRCGELVLGCSRTAIPQGVKRIGKHAFRGCLSLDSLVIPEGVKEIGAGAFADCPNLTAITLPGTLETLSGAGTFSGCVSLKSLHIPQNVSRIGEGIMLRQCLALERITVDKRNKTFDSRDDCNAIVETATDKLVVGCGRTRIVEGLREIASHAFAHAMMPSVSIPASVTRIQGGAFWGCSFCTAIRVDPRNPVYDSRNDCNAIIETATGTLVQGCATTRIPRDVTTIGEQAFAAIPLPSPFVIPEGVRSIAPKAFLGSPTLECVVIPASVDSVGVLAFSSCPWLWSVTWKGPTAHIGSSAFSDCRHLDLVEIPEGTRSIGDHAFANCESLQYVSLPRSLEQLSRSAFKDSPCDETVQAQQQDILCNRVMP